MQSNISRRAVLAGAPAVAATVAMPALAAKPDPLREGVVPGTAHHVFPLYKTLPTLTRKSGRRSRKFCILVESSHL